MSMLLCKGWQSFLVNLLFLTGGMALPVCGYWQTVMSFHKISAFDLRATQIEWCHLLKEGVF